MRNKGDGETEGHPIGNIPLVPPAHLRRALPKAGTKVKVKEEGTRENFLAEELKRFCFGDSTKKIQKISQFLPLEEVCFSYPLPYHTPSAFIISPKPSGLKQQQSILLHGSLGTLSSAPCDVAVGTCVAASGGSSARTGIPRWPVITRVSVHVASRHSVVYMSLFTVWQATS